MSTFTQTRTGVGTRQISDHSMNIMNGCGHDCKYCYAAHKSLQQGKIKQRAEWPSLSRSYSGAMKDDYPKYDGLVMYPTHHDIEPRHLHHHIALIRKLLASGNEILLTTKAHYECIDEISFVFERYKSQISFMFTITSLNDDVSRFWEPNAPCPHERLASLMLAFMRGYRTSVILEPMLEGPAEARAIYRRVLPFVTGEIWIGKMNSPTVRVDMSIPENEVAVKRILRSQSYQNIVGLYDELNGQDKVKWKESIVREVEKRDASRRVIPIGRSSASVSDDEPEYELCVTDASDCLLDEDGNLPELTEEEKAQFMEELYQEHLRLK